MCGSGARIGMLPIIIKIAQKKTPKEQTLELTACCAAAVGTAMRNTAGRLTASTALPAIAATTTASALCVSHSFGSYAYLVCSFELKKKGG